LNAVALNMSPDPDDDVGQLRYTGCVGTQSNNQGCQYRAHGPFPSILQTRYAMQHELNRLKCICNKMLTQRCFNPSHARCMAMYRGSYDMQARVHTWEPVQQEVMMILIWCWTKRELLRCGIVQKSKTEHGQTPTLRQQMDLRLCIRCVLNVLKAICCDCCQSQDM